MKLYFIVAAVAYLLGSIPFGYILVRLFRGQDIRQTGSGNIGATNVARSGAKGLGLATLLLDASKGFAAVFLALLLAHYGWERKVVLVGSLEAAREIARPGAQAVYILQATAAVFAIIGHVFPVWLKFKGGKGVATGVGAFLALAPKAVLIALVIFAALVAAFRYVSLGSIVGAAAFPILVWLLYGYRSTPSALALIMAASLLIIIKHKDNIRRLLAGTEHRFEFKKG